jgi:hypothetical protein
MKLSLTVASQGIDAGELEGAGELQVALDDATRSFCTVMVGLPSLDDVPDRAQVDDGTGEVHVSRRFR